jgi:hypothetical protein
MAKSRSSRRRASSRKMKHTRKHKAHRRRTHRRSTRRRGGADALSGAPVGYHLSGNWSSKMSLGQGADYFKYHEGQHGGALGMGNYPEAVLSPGLPAALRGPAHIGGIDKAINDVKGLCDPPNCPGTEGPVVKGGSRRNRSRRNKSRGGDRRSRNKSRRNRSYGGNRNRRNKNNAIAAANVANAAAEVAVANAVVANEAASVAVANSTVPAVGGRNRRNRRRSGGALGYAPFPSSGMLLSSPKAYAQAGLNPEWKTDVAFTDAKIRESQ